VYKLWKSFGEMLTLATQTTIRPAFVVNGTPNVPALSTVFKQHASPFTQLVLAGFKITKLGFCTLPTSTINTNNLIKE
jgi:hypothetical protein